MKSSINVRYNVYEAKAERKSTSQIVSELRVFLLYYFIYY